MFGILIPAPLDMSLDIILSHRSTDIALNIMAWFLLCQIPYRQKCPFPDYIQTIHLARGGLQSSWRGVSMITDSSGMHQNLIADVITKAVNLYVNGIFQSFIFNKLKKKTLL